MYGDNIHVQSKVVSGCSDEALKLIKKMGIDHVFTIFRDEDTNYDAVMRFMERLNKFGLICTDAGNETIYKNDKIHLGLEGRDEAIERYNAFNIILAKAGIHVGYMTWEPNKVLTSRFSEGKCTRGAVGRIVDIDELKQKPYSHGRFFSKEEIWENFRYFLERVLPVCEDIDLKIALHPNDPPVDDLLGISNLITSAEDYKKAFAMANNSPYLGMKFCVGCWLEGGDHFGSVLDDIKYFVENQKVLAIHFRNVSAPIPFFEETLLEDGYMDMYKIMKTFVENNYEGVIHVDHVPDWGPIGGGITAAWAYSTGYMKALLNAARSELKKS